MPASCSSTSRINLPVGATSSCATLSEQLRMERSDKGAGVEDVVASAVLALLTGEGCGGVDGSGGCGDDDDDGLVVVVGLGIVKNK